MAALTATNPTLLDWTKSLDPNGQVAAVVEILNQTNECNDDMTWMEGNLPTGHRTTIRTGIPTPTWRQYYGGTQPSKSRRAQVTVQCGMMTALSEVDYALANLGGNAAAFRYQEDRAQIEGMGQEFANTLFYGNAGTSPEEFTGFAPHYASLSGAESSDNVINGGAAGGQTDCTSIWLVVWSPSTVFGVVPQGSPVGLQVKDYGDVMVEDVDGSGGRARMYRSYYEWHCGVVIADWRYAVRIANIDKSLLVKDAASGADLPDLMFQAINLIPNMNMGRAAFYMARDTKTWLGRQTANLTKSSTLVSRDVGGKIVDYFQGVPIRRVDALAADENALT